MKVCIGILTNQKEGLFMFKKGIALLAIMFIGISQICVYGQDSERKGKNEFHLGMQMLDGDSSTFRGYDVGVDDAELYGFGFAYNFSEHITLNADLAFSSSDMFIEGDGDSAILDADISSIDLNIDYNIFANRLTPYISGGVGMIRFSALYGMAEESDFSYNYGAGIRWDISSSIFVKAGYKALNFKMKETDSSMQMDGFGFVLGFNF